MIERAVNLWDAHKHKLEEYFKTTKTDEYSDYKSILKALTTHVLNAEIDDWAIENGWRKLNVDRITEVDDGDYQGTLLYLIPLDVYQPSEWDYLWTSVGYGSCSGCDTLQAIEVEGVESRFPTEGQLRDYMMLALHLLQNMKYLCTHNY